MLKHVEEVIAVGRKYQETLFVIFGQDLWFKNIAVLGSKMKCSSQIFSREIQEIKLVIC